MNLEELFHRYKEHSIHGPYVRLNCSDFRKLNTANQLKVIGNRLGNPFIPTK
jgi:hypothetical protein